MNLRRTHAILISCLVVSLAACTRGKKKEPTPGSAVEGVPAQETTQPAQASAAAKGGDWEQGVLPDSLMLGEPRQGGEVVVQMPSEVPSLNTIVDSDLWASWVTNDNVYESLVRLDAHDPDFRHVPSLADRWEISEDKKTYTFYLRHGVKWHDGQPFSAKDVIATFDKIMDPKTKAVHVRSYFEELDRYEAVDDFTVRFIYKNPYFLTLDTFADYPIQPAHIIGKLTGTEYNDAASNSINRAPLGTGPFKFESWQANQKVVLARFDGYWGTKAHLDRLVFRIIKDETVALQLTERGEIDVLSRILADKWVDMKSEKLRSGFHRSRYFDANYAWIGWNEKRPFFAEAKVRRAMTMLVDRDGFISKIARGIPKATTCHFYWASRECDPSLKPLPFDPVGAAKLLEQAGWSDSDDDGVIDKDGVAFRFGFMIPAASVNSAKMATKLKEDLKRAGIDMSIQKVEWSAFTKRLRTHEFDACTLIWGGGPRGDPTQIWHSASAEGGSNYISYANPEVDTLLETARVTFDADARRDMYRKFGAILHEEQPYTWLYVRPRLSLVGKRLRGVKDSLLFWQFRDWWVAEP